VKRVNPFLKWPGGKRWLIPFLLTHLSDQPYKRYFEPFLGGGAVFFGLQPANAVLSDINCDLINVYEHVQKAPCKLIERVQQLEVSKETFLAVRACNPTDPLERAVRFLYLNRTAFGGMYRLDREGRFNVPYGGGDRTPAPLWKHNLLEDASQALQNAVLCSQDFEIILDEAATGDLVYCDPTCTVAHNNNGFIRYNERNFSWRDQIRLAHAARRAAGRGATVLVSNAYHHSIAELYSEAEVHVLDRKSLLSPNPEHRQTTQEYLFVLNPIRCPHGQGSERIRQSHS
jgi:DNA adenine methylase